MTRFIRPQGYFYLLACCLSLAAFAGCGGDDEQDAQAKNPPQTPTHGQNVKVPDPPPGAGTGEDDASDEDQSQTAENVPPAETSQGPPMESTDPASPAVDPPVNEGEGTGEPPTEAEGGTTPDEGEAADDGDVPDSVPPREEPKPLEPPPEAEGLKRFVDGNDLWVDVKNKRVVLAGRVVQRSEQVPLELFACRKGTKEHEAIVAVQVTAFFVHACLVAAGGEFGHPVRFWTADRQPMYEAAEGCVVKVTVHWDHEDGARRSMPAQQWLFNSRTKTAMQEPWVFAGSQFYKPTPEDKPFYLAEDGDLICVSNFPSALLDVPVESSSEESHLLYRPLTENIPPVGTPVTIVLEPEPGLREPISAPRIEQEAPVEPTAEDQGTSEPPAGQADPAEQSEPESP